MNHHPIIALAPNGAHKQKSDHPALPVTLDELIETAVKAQRSGATLLHLHIRDEHQQHSLNTDTYLRTIDAIKARTGDTLIIQITSEAAGIYSPEQQIACIRGVKPESASIALRELVPNAASLPAAQSLFHWCAEQQCCSQFILYNESDLLAYLGYRENGVIPAAPHSLLFVLGHYTLESGSTLGDLAPFLKHLDRIDVPWMVCAFGVNEQHMLLEAAARGGHMRIGFENNLLTPAGNPARDNTEQLNNLVHAAVSLDLRPASIEETRKILHIDRK